MFTLSKTRLAKRSFIFLVFFISILAGFFAAAKTVKMFQVNAAEGSADVDSDGIFIPYDKTGTYRYSVTVDGEFYDALCAEPSKAPPAGSSYDYSVLNNDKIKLLVYLALNENSAAANSLVRALYGDDLVSTSDRRFAYIHATIGAINGDYNGLSDDNRDKIEAIANGTGSGSIAYAISSNADAWLIAKNYTLYTTNPGDYYQSVVWIESDFQLGSIKVQKCDEETGSCTQPQGAASFSGIKFEVYNASGSRIYIPSENQFYDNNALIASEPTNASGNITFSGLPLNVLYKVVETSTNKSYLLTATPRTTTITVDDPITVDGHTKNLDFYDDVVRGDLKFTKTSDVDGEPMANVIFKIKSTSGAKEEHLVVTDEDGVVDTSASHALHSFHTNGYDDMEEDGIEYLAYGTWFGGGTVDDQRGALPYDTYEITELECDANKFCYDIGDTKKTVTIKTDGEVVDLKEWSNDCAEFSIATTATDNSDGDKILAYDQDVEIKDVVDYCLKKDMEFTIKGVVMNKNTKEPLLVDGKKVEQTITLTPDSACGTTEMIYSLNTKDLGGTDLVIFEELYYGDELILSHSDFDNVSQTVSVAPPPPDTGAITKTTNGGILSNNAMIIVFAIGGSLGLYASARAFSRKRFLNKKY